MLICWLVALVAPVASTYGATPPSPSPNPGAAGRLGELRGRVFQRGSSVGVAAAITVSSGETTTADRDGRFALLVAPGRVDVAVRATGFELLRVSETVVAGQGIHVDYYLTSQPGNRYVSTVRGEARHEGEHFSVRDEELHQLPGGLGDPFRAIGLMPGVATPLSLLPYYVVRGASPGNSGYFLDGMQVPQLFHLLVGGGVVNSQLIDKLDFYPGAYDVSFGHYAGAIVDSETRSARPQPHGEAELRIYDASVMVEDTLHKDIKIEAAGHYGYPGYIIRAFDSGVNASYWDYQLRIDWRGLTVEALGSYDLLTIDQPQTNNGVTTEVPDAFRLAFHRLQIRDRQRFGRVELEAALVGGIDQMVYFGGSGVQKLSLGARFLVRARWSRFSLFAGVDGELSKFTPSNFGSQVSAQEPDELGDLAGQRAGVVAGAFAEGTVDVVPHRLQVTLGARVDTYHSDGVTLLGIDPRLQLRANLLPWLHLTAGFGLYQQPPSFPIPLPGIDTFALQLGLQRSWQGAVGFSAEGPQHFTFSITGYYSKLSNVNDVAVDFGPAVCTAPPPESLTGFPADVTRQVNGEAYGMEVLLRRHAGRFTGWIAYTLSRSERVYSCGLRPSDFDQTHVLNVVLQVRLPGKFMLGTRFYYATGRPVTELDPLNLRAQIRNNVRLPDTIEWDLRVDREWLFKRWALSAFLEVLNITYGQAIFGLSYPNVDGNYDYLKPGYNGFRWVLPSVGLRARF